MNLLSETVEMLRKNGKQPADVQWVGSSDGRCVGSWADFEAVANIDYDAGFGGQEVSENLVVVGVDWWLERHEYDGSEWWEVKARPMRAADAIGLPSSLLARDVRDRTPDGKAHPLSSW